MKFDEMNREKKTEAVELFANWLKPYTKKVINNVLARRDEILNNDFVMNLLRELRKREDKEKKTLNILSTICLMIMTSFRSTIPTTNHSPTQTATVISSSICISKIERRQDNDKDLRKRDFKPLERRNKLL